MHQLSTTEWGTHQHHDEPGTCLVHAFFDALTLAGIAAGAATLVFAFRRLA